MKLDLVITSLGESGEIDLSVVIHPKIIFLAKMNFCSAFPCSQLVTLNNRQINSSFFIAQICTSLDEHISFDITHTGIAVTVIITRFRGKEKGEQKSKHAEKYRCFSHFSSFPNPIEQEVCQAELAEETKKREN
jgi:hypothetical protein